MCVRLFENSKRFSRGIQVHGWHMKKFYNLGNFTMDFLKSSLEYIEKPHFVLKLVIS